MNALGGVHHGGIFVGLVVEPVWPGVVLEVSGVKPKNEELFWLAANNEFVAEALLPINAFISDSIIDVK